MFTRLYYVLNNSRVLYHKLNTNRTVTTKMAMTSTHFIIMLCLLHLLAATFVSAEWMTRRMMKIATDNILQKIEDVSITSCSLKCKQDRMCTAFGTERDMKIGEVGECYMLSDDKETGNQDEMVTRLFVASLFVTKEKKGKYYFGI